jgi:hypothetical protein
MSWVLKHTCLLYQINFDQIAVLLVEQDKLKRVEVF